MYRHFILYSPIWSTSSHQLDPTIMQDSLHCEFAGAVGFMLIQVHPTDVPSGLSASSVFPHRPVEVWQCSPGSLNGNSLSAS